MGRKSVPDNLVKKIIRWAKLTKDEASELVTAASISKKEFVIPVGPGMTSSDLQTAAMLARFGELPAKDRDHIKEILQRRLG
jgi:hypothetical protein